MLSVFHNYIIGKFIYNAKLMLEHALPQTEANSAKLDLFVKKLKNGTPEGLGDVI